MSDVTLIKATNHKKRKRQPPQHQQQQQQQKDSSVLEEKFQREQEERFHKLKHVASKALHKEAKIVKSFECQKLVRKLKQTKSSIDQQEKLLAQIKAFSLHHVERVCMQRLGIDKLNGKDDKQDETKTTTNTTVVELNGEHQELVDRIMKHKRMVSCLATWEDKVADFRSWCTRRQEQIHQRPDAAKKEKVVHSQKKKQPKKLTSVQGNGLFVAMGGTTIDDNDDDNDDDDVNVYHGDPFLYEDEYTDIVQKKNRPGQRARRAKTMAIQARRQGRVWDSSLNWREKKKTETPWTTRPKDHCHSQTTKMTFFHKNRTPQPTPATTATTTAATAAVEIATMGKHWKDEGKEHPSWVARQSQKSGIVPFAGQKITFD